MTLSGSVDSSTPIHVVKESLCRRNWGYLRLETVRESRHEGDHKVSNTGMKYQRIIFFKPLGF